jgi:hypothetical protein
MAKRHSDALYIGYVGASNLRGVANSLVEAMDEVRKELGDRFYTDALAEDPAIKVIAHHLGFLLGANGPGLTNWVDLCLAEARASGHLVPRELQDRPTEAV